MEFQGAVFNLADASLSKDGRQCELTKNEFKILQLLLENKNKVVSREKIMLKLWNNDCFVDENTLTVNVNRLRRKIDVYKRQGLGGSGTAAAMSAAETQYAANGNVYKRQPSFCDSIRLLYHKSI